MLPDMYTVKDVQGLLKISPVTAYKLVRSGEFPVIRIGRSYRVPADTFVQWVHTSRFQPAEPYAMAESDACILSQIRNGGVINGKL